MAEEIACDRCGTTVVIEDIPPDCNPLPAEWTEQTERIPVYPYEQTVALCGECAE